MMVERCEQQQQQGGRKMQGHSHPAAATDLIAKANGGRGDDREPEHVCPSLQGCGLGLHHITAVMHKAAEVRRCERGGVLAVERSEPCTVELDTQPRGWLM